MPLIHSKSPSAFKENIKTEIAHGKPPKQAVAIAYSEKREAEHMSDGGCVGSHCTGCASPTCMSHGGSVESEHDGDDEHLSDGLGEELMSALHSKDKKGIMSAIEAVVMRCMSKGEM